MSDIIPSNKSLVWQQIILKQKVSGQSSFSWCEQNHIPYSTFCYWKRRFSKPLLNRNSFVEVQDNDVSTGVQLECKGIKVLLEKNFDTSTLSKALTLLKAI